jgi:hypothetical protein
MQSSIFVLRNELIHQISCLVVMAATAELKFGRSIGRQPTRATPRSLLNRSTTEHGRLLRPDLIFRKFERILCFQAATPSALSIQNESHRRSRFEVG